MTPIENVKPRTAEAAMQPTDAISATGGAPKNDEQAETPIQEHSLPYDRRHGCKGMNQEEPNPTLQRRGGVTLAQYARTKKLGPQFLQLATQKDILTRFEEAFGRRSVVGEGRIAKLLYLALTSRFLQRPVSVAVKGPSSGGKSFLTQQVLRFFPLSAYWILTGTSDRALAFWDEPLQHRFLVILESTGLQGEMASYFIRSLLSEGRISYLTVEKTNYGMQPRLLEVEGPVGLITTTTAIRLHPENETRWFCVDVDDTPEQTHKVLKATAKSVNQDADATSDEEIATFVELHEWLAVAKHDVTIPYAEALADKIPPVAIRLRRDFERVLRLIMAHAILHQATRQVDKAGRIIATLEDYRAVRDVGGPILSQELQISVSDKMRETVEAVREANKRLPRGGGGASVKQVAEILKLHTSTISRRIDACLERGYLRSLKSKRGSAYQLIVGDPLPGDVQILPDPELLEGCCSVAADSGGIGPPPLCPELSGSAILDAERYFAAASSEPNQEAA
jgi:hypothetical protein